VCACLLSSLDTIFCVDLDKYAPDIVLIDFSVNDYGHPKLMDALIRKVLMLPSKPIVLIVDLWVTTLCGTPRYLLHSFYYQIPLLDVCPAVALCYGKDHHPKHVYEEYSKTDGVHPWGSNGVKFLGQLLYAWWKKFDAIVSYEVSMTLDGKQVSIEHSFDSLLQQGVAGSGVSSSTAGTGAGAGAGGSSSSEPTSLMAYQRVLQQLPLPPPLYPSNPIGLCTRCDALAEDADGMLTPVRPPIGFRKVVRMKIGYGGFTAKQDDKYGATKSFRKSWQADTPGSEISFRFYGSTVKVGR
jgi:hypothetical protein